LGGFFLNEQGTPDQVTALLSKLKARITDALKALEAVEGNWQDSDPRYPDELSDLTCAL
jgi:hypothetical protein